MTCPKCVTRFHASFRRMVLQISHFQASACVLDSYRQVLLDVRVMTAAQSCKRNSIETSCSATGGQPIHINMETKLTDLGQDSSQAGPFMTCDPRQL